MKKVLFILLLLSLLSIPMVVATPVLATNETTASSLSDEDVQDAIDYIEGLGVGTVNLPSGNGTWNANVVISGNVSLIGAGANITNINTDEGYGLILYDGANGTRVSAISFFNEAENANGIAVKVGNNVGYGDTVVDFRIDNCYFQDYGQQYAPVTIWGDRDCRGLIDHNVFKCTPNPPSQFGYGVEVIGGNTYTANVTPYLGTQQAIFIEDNYFYNHKHATVCTFGGVSVVRYNHMFTNLTDYWVQQQIDQHGQTSGSAHSGVLLEAYNNTITWTGADPQVYGYKGFNMRGGDEPLL